MSVTLKDEKVIDRWSMVIENGRGNGEQILAETEKFIRESEAPGVEFERVSVKTSWLKGLFGQKREYLMASNEGLSDYRMFVTARDYGKNLDVSWYLTCEPGFFKRRFSMAITEGASDKALSLNLDLFEQQDLNAYATVVHHCLIRAIESMMASTGQDASKIERKSRGFLGIS